MISLLFKTFIAFVFLDVASGIYNSAMKGIMNSKTMKQGILKKLGLVFIVILTYFTSLILENDLIYNSTLIFYIVEEGMSVLENTQDYIPIPDSLKKALGGLNGNKE